MGLFNKINTDRNKIKEVLTRGVEKIMVREELEERLLSGKKLRIKLGIDPTGPNIHIGRAAQLWKLKDFQELGHQAVLIIGDFTARIGDASDKQAERASLTEKQIKENMEDYLSQIGKVIDLDKTDIRHNSEWLAKMPAKELLSLDMKFTAQQMIQRRNFKERWEEGKEIGLHELNYPVLQGYDSFAVKADVEIGGSDQLFNLLTGRDIQEIFGKKPQNIMILKMIDGLDGRKMSTSWGNVININDKPNDMFGKVMSMRDEMIRQYFLLATRLSQESIDEKMKGFDNNPRDAKIELAWEMVAIYYDKKTADKARDNFIKVFQKKEAPDDILEVKVKKDKKLEEILLESGLVKSKSEFRRLAKEGAVEDGKDVIRDINYEIKADGPDASRVIKVGKKRFIKIILKDI